MQEFWLWLYILTGQQHEALFYTCEEMVQEEENGASGVFEPVS